MNYLLRENFRGGGGGNRRSGFATRKKPRGEKAWKNKEWTGKQAFIGDQGGGGGADSFVQPRKRSKE